MNQKSEEFFKRLKTELENANEWPAIYLFKFIVPTDKVKSDQVQQAFDGMGAVIDTKKSKNGNYTSISINVQMQDPQSVVEKYIELSIVEGIISL